MSDSLSSVSAPELTRPTSGELGERVHRPRTDPMATGDTLYARRVVDSLEDRELSPYESLSALITAESPGRE